jgi:hypothetical protein
MTAEQVAKAESLGFSDRQIALTGCTKNDLHVRRKKLDLFPTGLTQWAGASCGSRIHAPKKSAV